MTERSHQGALKGTSIKEIGKTIQKTDDKGKVFKNSPSIVNNLKTKKPALKEGYTILGPEELGTLLVPKQQLNEKGNISGFQRDITRPHIRRIGEAYKAGETLPVIDVALYQNALWIVDGQHRALGAIVANEKVPVLIRKMDADEMRKLFASQAKARRVNPSTLILSADNPYAEYVQDAVTASNEDENPWFGMVTHKTSSQTRITPLQLHESVTRYVANTLGTHYGRIVNVKEFERDKADELARLFKTFGTKKSNPLAFKPISVRAMVYAAVLIIRRRGSFAEDIKRWENHMATFPWKDYAHIRRSNDLSIELIKHWNKRLHQANKVKLDEIA